MDPNPKPAEVFHPAVILEEELAAREWTLFDLAILLPGGDPLKALLALQLYVGVKDPNCRLGDMAKDISVALGCSPDFWPNLEAQYLQAIDGGKDHLAPV